MSLKPLAKSLLSDRHRRLLARMKRSLLGRMHWFAPTDFYLCIDTAHCNLRCTLCPNSGIFELDGPGRGLMSIAMFRRIVEKFRRENARISHLELGNWGEPLLNPEISEIIAYARKSPGFLRTDAKISVNTTLNLLPSARDFARSGVDHVNVTISGMSQRVYERYHKGGKIDRVLHNLAALTAARDSTENCRMKLYLRFLNFNYNETCAKSAERFCTDHGITFISVRGRMTSVDCHIRVHQRGNQASKLYRDFIDLPHEESLMTTIDPKDIEYCNLRWNRITLNFDGRMFRCCGLFEQNYLMGSIFDLRVADIPLTDSPICARCAVTPLSNGRHILTF